ncbi:ATP-grasp domain-containing protein [Lysinibacillus capsici]|uniref:ATP-grasp domain-containing protein n=1 Tax=Lysinibacillus capsici TaxID=2115968 RepID=UPI002E2085E3|nr:ATP-grasp domain-containing protein [Lysinibacillus capsici]
MKKTILITGLAGDIGRNIARILKEEWPNTKIIGIDINSDFPFSNFADIFIKGVKVAEEYFISFIEDLIEEYDIDFIIPTSEIELRYFCNNKIKEIRNIPLIMADFNSMEIGFDKWLTVQFLKENNFDYPKTLNSDELDNAELIKSFPFPAILKEKKGAGGNGVYFVTNEEFNILKKLKRCFILQEYLSGNFGEYTCGLVRFDNEIKTIIFKRKLAGDKTSYAEVVQNEQINNFLINLAKSVNLNGSINIQLRLTEEGPKVFEINPRFSSTVYFRYKLGFKDVIWSILHQMDMSISYDTYDEDDNLGKKIFRDENIIIY